jgi:hypothetical protein
LALAALPQKMVLPVSGLEPEFQGRVDGKTGLPITELYGNKGL